MRLRLELGSVLGSVLLVYAQVTHTVEVGQFYVPPTISALEGDIVQFLFTSGHHGVTQGVGISDPCSQLPGGFNSGVTGGFVANETNQPPMWSLTVTNASDPIFFYCAVTIPSFHCANGMVGAINALPDQYTSYSLAAKSVTGTPVQTSSVVLTGVGAMATVAPFTPTPSALPTTVTTSQSDMPSSTDTSSFSPLPSETDAPSSSSSSTNAAAIGGGIGGGIAVAAIVIVGFLLSRARDRRKQAQEASAADDSFLNVDGEKYEPSRDPATPPGLGGFSSSNNLNQGNLSMIAGAGPNSQLSRTVGTRRLANMDGSSDAPYSRSTTYTLASGPLPTQQSEPPYSGGFPGQEIGARQIGNREHATLQQHQQQPQYSAPVHAHTASVNVHEIAKEVASLLGPQLRVANAASPPPPSAQPVRSLPIPYGSSAKGLEPPRSPVPPPRYNQYAD